MEDVVITPIVVSVHRKNDNPIFGESTIHVRIEDGGNGPYLILSQCLDGMAEGEVKLNIDELQHILVAASQLMNNYPKEEK